MSKYAINLSTTEPNNNVGLLKFRQGDTESQTLEVSLTENGLPFNFDQLAVYFNAVLPSGNVIRDKVEAPDYTNSKLTYVIKESFLQDIAYITAWFSFEKGEEVVDSTKNFRYLVIAGWKESIKQGNYIYELSEIQREIEEIISNKDFTSLIAEINDFKTRMDYLGNTKADVDYVNNVLSKIASGAPDGVYDTFNQLVAAFPSGNNKIYVVKATGYWYYWNGSKWTAGGLYQGVKLAARSVEETHLSLALARGIAKEQADFYYTSGKGCEVDYANKKITFFEGVKMLRTSNRNYMLGEKEYQLIFDSTTVYICYDLELDEFKALSYNEWYSRAFSNTLVYLCFIRTLNGGETDLQAVNSGPKTFELIRVAGDSRFGISVDYENKCLIIDPQYLILISDKTFGYLTTGENEQTIINFDSSDTTSNQILIYHERTKELKFISSKRYFEIESTGWLYGGFINISNQQEMLKIKQGLERENGEIISISPVGKAPEVDYVNNQLIFDALNYYVINENGYYPLNNERIAVNLLVNSSSNYIIFNKRTKEIKSILAVEFMYYSGGNTKNWLFLGVIFTGSYKKSYLHYRAAVTQEEDNSNKNRTLKISILGDSIWSFKGAIPEENYGYYPNGRVSNLEEMQFKLLEKANGKIVVNNSWGGSRITSTRVDITPTILRAENLAIENVIPDTIIIAQGINDYFGGVKIHEDELDEGEDPMRCFEYAYKKIIEKCQELYPYARIILCSFMFFNYESSNENIAIPNKAGRQPQEYLEVIERLAEEYGCVYVDMYHMGVNIKNFKRFYVEDDVHPGPEGMRLMYSKVQQALLNEGIN